MAAPTLAALATSCASSTRVVETSAAFAPLARLLPGVHEVVERPAGRGLRGLREQARQLAAGRFDAAVVLPRSLRAALAPRLAGIAVRVGYGTRCTRHLLTHAATGWRPLRSAHRSRWFGLLAEAFGPFAGEAPALTPQSQDLEAGERVLRGLGRRRERPLVALEPGASYGAAKCWPADRFGQVAAALLAQGADVVTVGTAASASVERVVARGAGPGLLRAVGHTPSLSALIGLLAQARLLITNDTGPMHLAAAIGTPVLALFGATDPVVSRPLGHGPRQLIFDPEPCSPCFLRECPVPGHPCLSKIGVARVLREAQSMLEARAQSLPGS